jgi:MoaA/NifB/PqqE/SkfB family radical SAM enzyme
VDDQDARDFDRSRSIGHQPFRSLCYAPFTSLYLDARGNAIACCQNTSDVLGNVRETPLTEIWHGPRARELRRRLAADQFPAGCRFCSWQFDSGVRDGHFATLFDPLPATEVPEWPVQLELALSNRCNLACVMCNGDLSSTIRRQEGRPPLPVQYDDGFFDQLRPFLAHLEVARFFGGEPFLIPEYQRIWDLMIEDGLRVRCDVTTNGTVRTPRIEATLDRLPFSIGVSVDGITPATIEAVRRGADAATVLDNVAWFHRHCRERGTGFGLTYCLMTHNWHEFAAFLAFADDLDAPVAVNTVVHPPASSLHQLPADELAATIDALAATAVPLGRNQAVWDRELVRLGGRLDELRGRGDDGPVHWFEGWGVTGGQPSPVVTSQVPLPSPRAAAGLDEAGGVALLAARSGLEPSRIRVDGANRVVDAGGPGGRFLGIELDRLLGRTFPEVVVVLHEQFGIVVGEEEAGVAGNGVERRIRFRDGERVTAVTTLTVLDPDAGSGAPPSTTFAVHEVEP